MNAVHLFKQQNVGGIQLTLENVEACAVQKLYKSFSNNGCRCVAQMSSLVFTLSFRKCIMYCELLQRASACRDSGDAPAERDSVGRVPASVNTWRSINHRALSGHAPPCLLIDSKVQLMQRAFWGSGCWWFSPSTKQGKLHLLH